MTDFPDIRIRVAGVADVPEVLGLFDRAVEWLAASGRAGQWGTDPWSAQPRRVEQIRKFATGGGLRVAEIAGSVAGALKLGAAPWYVPPPQEPELYLEAFVVDRRHAGFGVGRALLDRACAEAAGQRAAVLRLDCWAGGDGALVRYYERAGFTPAGRFTVAGNWPGQILIRRLAGPSGRSHP